MPSPKTAKVIGLPGMPELPAEDASFIIRACNAHAGLVEALEELLAAEDIACDLNQQTDIAKLDAAMVKARAALQSAKE